jgi:Cdc6-like AAA superfamily ATPase
MDPEKNPFVPGAGTRPAKLAGRQDLLTRTEVMLNRVKGGRYAKSFIVVGLRGVGKTVLLLEVYEKAKSLGYQAIQIEAHEEKSLAALLVPKLRQVLFSLDNTEKAKNYVKRGFRALASFVQSAKLKYSDIEFSLSIEPEIGSADSGDIEVDLADLFEIIGEAAKEKKTALCFIIDELQYISEKEMSALIMAMPSNVPSTKKWKENAGLHPERRRSSARS